MTSICVNILRSASNLLILMDNTSQNTKHIPVFQTKNVHTLYIISGQNVLKPYPQGSHAAHT